MLSYQDLIIKITETLIDAGTDHFFDAIKETLGDIALFYDLDRASIMIYDQTMTSIRPSVEWTHVGIMPRIPTMSMFILNDHFPWKEFHKNKKIYTITHLDNDQNDSSRKLFSDVLTQAAMMIPLHHQDTCFGFLLLENVSSAKDWTIIDSKVSSLLAKLFEDAFYRQKQMSSSEDELSHISTHFMHNMSHEMKTPLGGIHHALYLLSTTELSDEQTSYVALGQEASDSLNSLIDHMLDMTPYDADARLNTYTFNIEEEMLRIHRSFKHLIDQKGLDFYFDFDYRITFDLIGDVIKLRQILNHLLDNAVKFTHQGSISCQVHLDSKDPLTIQFKIIDTGIGIPQEHMSRLYDPFFQGDMSSTRGYRGAGLGLPIVKKFIDLMGGHITFESKVNQGTTVSFCLPLEKGHPMDFSSVHHYHILWMHDDKEPSPLIDALSSMGMTVVDKDQMPEEKADIIFIDQKIKSMEEIDHLKDQFGGPTCLIMVLEHLILKPSKKIDIFIEYPFSRHTIMHKIIHSEHERIKQKEDASYGALLHGTTLVVDDNRLNRIALESILVKEGIDVILAESGEKAIEIIKKESVDLILMDIQMPIMDGIETTRRIRSLGHRFEKIAIVAVTANAYFNDYDMLKSAKINDVIFKPIHMDHLKQVLRKYMQVHDVLHVPDDLFVWDEHDFNKRFEGSENIALDVLSIFIKEYASDMKKIKHAIHAQHKEDIMQTVHYFKGSCGYVSGKRAVWVLNKMLEEVKRDMLTHMEDNYKILESEIYALIEQLKASHG